MVEKYIKMLRGQIDKLEAEGFDLEAWKSSAISILARIFGEKDPKVKQIADIKIEFNSWSLRDVRASYKPLDSCKKRGKEIIDIAIEELENFGLPKESLSDQAVFYSVLEQELTGKQFKDIKSIIEDIDDPEKRRTKLLEKLKKLNAETSAKIIAGLLGIQEIEEAGEVA
ncbi:MAG: hypothetical protein AAFX87_23545 [Bacteroidota bacterium]